MSPTAVRLVAAREVTEQARGRALWISTVILVVAIVALIVLPAELKGGRPTYHVVVASPAAGVTGAVEVAAASAGAHVVITTVGDEATARADVAAKGPARADIAVLGGSTPEVVVDQAAPANATSTKALVTDAVARQVSVALAVDHSGLPTAQARALAAPVALPIGHLRPASESGGQRAAGLAAAILFFILVQRYGFGLLMGIIHEKSGRVVEILLSAVRPVELLAGKVVGSTYLPPTAPLDMPVLTAAGDAGPLNVALSMLICVIGTVVVARAGATIFARSILHTGGRIKVRQVLRSEPRRPRVRDRVAVGTGR